MINLEVKSKINTLFQSGLFLFSIAPSAIVFLLLLVGGAGFLWSLISALTILLALQVTGFLYGRGVIRHPFILRISFWTLKMMQPVLAMAAHTPEKMVIAMNNRKAVSECSRKFRGEETLILVPHCLQNHECSHRLTFNPESCERCGRCPIGDLLEIRNRFNTHFAIASGGTSARRIVERIEPSLIIAVACPVDLSLGILDVHPVTTVGVLNEWRHGPCFDTWVNPAELEAALEMFTQEDTILP